MNVHERLQALGVSIWLRGVRRDLLDAGALAGRLAAGEIQGAIADPGIFSEGLVSGEMYTASIRPLAQAGWPAERVLETIRVDDVRAAADLLLPLYERTNGEDGYVVLDVSPASLRDHARTMEEARWLWASVNRPNLMVGIPVSGATLSAIEEVTAEGINVHAFGLFSLERYAEALEARSRGLEARLARGDSIHHVASVASFSLTRLDAHLDGRLLELTAPGGAIGERAQSLLHRSGIALAKLVHAQFRAAIASERFLPLSQRGARPQRLMWSIAPSGQAGRDASAALRELAGAHTVLSLPPEALPLDPVLALDEPTIDHDLSAARGVLDALESLGISMTAVSEFLESEGLARLSATFDEIGERMRASLKSLRGEIAGLAPLLPEVISRLDAEALARRLWQGDPGLWVDPARQAEEVRGRLGWLHLPQASEASLSDLARFAAELRQAGFRQAVLLGMGGSSLAPDVFRRALGRGQGLRLHVLDSTDPAAILEISRLAPPAETLYVVASKSGTTAEPLALLEHFWAEAAEQLGAAAPAHFAAITDPGTPLERLARERGFRRVFLGPPDVGGRFSALSIFGLLPAALLGLDLEALLRGGARMAHACGPKAEAARNPGVFLGAILAAGARSGHPKLTILADPEIAPLADWIEQLVAESSGKEGRGILPIVGEPPGAAKSYGKDRLLVYLRLTGSLDSRVGSYAQSGLPVAVLDCAEGSSGLGAEFFRWEVATAVACHALGVNAFDQPDVQRAKSRTNDLLKAYTRRGILPSPPVLWEGSGLRLAGDREQPGPPPGSDLRGFAAWLLMQLDPGKGLALLAYLHQKPALERRLAALRKTLRHRLGISTTLGFGPRYLHSTGQIHKGGPDDQVFLIITAKPEGDVPIPGAGYSFGVLERAQAVGDLQALLERGRRAFGLQLDSPSRMRELTAALCAAASTQSSRRPRRPPRRSAAPTARGQRSGGPPG